MPDEREIERTEAEAVLETRRELGSTYDAALVDSFADRIEAAVAARTAQELSRRRESDRGRASAGPRQLALGIVSVVVGLPAVTAISVAVPEDAVVSLGSLVLGWAGIIAVNMAHAIQSRGTDRPR